MNWRRLGPVLLIVIIISVFSPAALSASPAGAVPRRDQSVKPSFSDLVLKFRQVTNRFSRLLIGPKGTGKNRLEPAVVAMPKGDNPVAGAAAAAFKPTPTPPIPDGAPRDNVSASGPFSALVAEAGRKDLGGGGTVAVGYARGTYYLMQNGRTIATSNRPIKIEPAGGTILSLPDFQDPNWNNTANLNAFRGNIEVAYSAAAKQLWAVNELSLEDYLRGMAEASADAPEEHLKVMAIVSRSYAVHHLAAGGRYPGEPYQLKNSRNGNGDDQVYRGYNAEMRQPRIAKSVGDTIGTVVTYQGRPVITPYSTQPGGRTLSPAEAHWKVDWPWVQSVPDPDTSGMPR
ncbi:MAG: SpoIID/LytB domain-containing protein, partial [Actinomycetota bacterium]|nr:SpoIID/LytB domain-containing protein [Actinomycetota bacterium]